MKEIKGDFFKHLAEDWNRYDCIVCTTNMTLNKNGELVMGAGIAKSFKENFPLLPEIFGKQVQHRKRGITIHYQYSYEHQYKGWIVGLPTKDDWKLPSIPYLIEFSLMELHEFVILHRIKSVLMTKPGCHNGGLKWEDIKGFFPYGLSNRVTIIDR